MTKAIIIGTSLSGKTTLIRYLRSQTQLPISEMDEKLTQMNGGKYPTDNKQKHTVLAPQIIKEVLNNDSLVFFTNTDYFTDRDLQIAHEKGFKIIQLFLSLEDLQTRNTYRVQHEEYADLSQWLEGMVFYQKELQKKQLVDKIILADKPTEAIAQELLEFLDGKTP